MTARPPPLPGKANLHTLPRPPCLVPKPCTKNCQFPFPGISTLPDLVHPFPWTNGYQPWMPIWEAFTQCFHRSPPLGTESLCLGKELVLQFLTSSLGVLMCSQEKEPLPPPDTEGTVLQLSFCNWRWCLRVQIRGSCGQPASESPKCKVRHWHFSHVLRWGWHAGQATTLRTSDLGPGHLLVLIFRVADRNGSKKYNVTPCIHCLVLFLAPSSQE